MRKKNEKINETKGLSLDLIKHISQAKDEPAWMLEKRIHAFALWERTPMPQMEIDLSAIDFKNLKYYTDLKFTETDSLKNLPNEITDAFDEMGIKKKEKDSVGGVGIQYDSGMVYRSMQKKFKDLGIIFENMDVAVRKFPELVQKYFMTDCLPAEDHKFLMLNGAVWSGGALIYIPKGVKVDLPLQACFRQDQINSGQFPHTIIVADEGSSVECIEGCSSPMHSTFSLHNGCAEIYVLPGASVKYSSAENLSKSTYNVAIRKALVYENASMGWSSINTGSCATMLYPESVLLGKGAKTESSSVVVAGVGQTQNIGSKIKHVAPNTTSIIRSRSISRGGGVSNYRGSVHVLPDAKNITSSVECEALILDDISESNTYPLIKNESDKADIAHEARVGKIGEEELFYLESRGFTKEEAIRVVVNGFVNPVVKSLPLEHALGFKEIIGLGK